MATGTGNEDGKKPLDVEGNGQSAGVPAEAELEGNAYNPLGNPGVQHWQQGYITRPGLEDRSNIFFAAVEMTRMPMAVTDPNQPDNPVVFVNKAFLDLTEYTEQQVVGRNCRFLQGEQTDPNTVAEIREAVQAQRAVAVDILNYKADGTPFWNALFAGPVFDGNGKLLYWFSSQMDITRRRYSEQTFRQAQKMEAIGQLTAGMAHDFNNLMQVVTGNLEVVAERAGNDPVMREALASAQKAAEKGGQLTQQLLSFARKQRLTPKKTNLNSLVIEFSELLNRTLGENVNLRLDLQPGLPSCLVDPIHMEMALLNVLINARDAMPHGGKVTIETTVLQRKERLEAHHLPPGKYVVICVIDQGEGMSPEVQRRAMEPFFTTKELGTGLGLAMVHGFMQQSHGRMEIESKQGKGTVVRMIFPVAVEHAVPPPKETWHLAAESPTILLVDDSDDVRHVAENHLHALGYQVLTAASGEEALKVLEEKRKIDLLFTDVIMPGGMNGLVLAERVRQFLPGLPVLLTTGYMAELAEEPTASSFAVLSKPYRRSELADKIRMSLNECAAPKRHEG